MVEMTVQEVDLVEWKTHPVTRAVLAMAVRRIQELHDKFDDGHYTSDNPHVTQGMVARAVGAISVYRELLTMDEEDINS